MYKIKLETTLHLKLPWPPSVNHYWGERVIKTKTGRYTNIKYIGDKGKKFRKDVEEAVSGHLEHCHKYFHDKDARLAVVVRVRPPDRRRRDINNLGKALFDALEHAGAYRDDEQIDDEHHLRDKDDIVPGGEIEISIGLIDSKLENYDG